MGIEFYNESASRCDECRKRVEDGDSCYCDECFTRNEERIEELEQEVKNLIAQINDSKSQQEERKT